MAVFTTTAFAESISQSDSTVISEAEEKTADEPENPIQQLAAPSLSKIINVSGGVSISWTPSGGAEKYRILRKTGTDTWRSLADVTTASYTDRSVISGQTYTYTVRCISSDGLTYVSDFAKAAKKIRYIAAPAIEKTSNILSGIQLNWTRSAGAEKYRIFRKTGSGNWQRLSDTTALTYTDKAVTDGKVYTYTVRCISADLSAYTSAYDTAGKSVIRYTAPSLSKAESISSGVRISWKATSKVSAYRVYRRTGSSGWIRLSDSDKTYYIDKSVASGQKYTYTVRSITTDGRLLSAFEKGITVTYIAAPALSKAENYYDCVNISWKKSAGAAKYSVFRKTTGTWTKLGTTSATSFADKTAKAGTTYAYTVRCISSSGKVFVSGYDSRGLSIKRRVVIRGWVTSNGKTCYYDQTGKKYTSGVYLIDSHRYMFDQTGIMLMGWQKVKGGYSLFDRTNGRRIENKTVDKIKIGASGVVNPSGILLDRIKTMIKARNLMLKNTSPADTMAEKRYKCFMWVMHGTYHRYHYFSQLRNTSGWEVIYANDEFDYHQGDCISDSAAIAFLFREIGYSGVYICHDTGHAWVMLDGRIYDSVFAESKSFSNNYNAVPTDYRSNPVVKLRID